VIGDSLRRIPAIFQSRRMVVVLMLGFSSGIPYFLVGQTMNMWLTDAGIDTKTIATFASIGLPYTLKFLWAPLVDRYPLPFLGRRRGWLFAFQLALLASLIVMATIDPVAYTHEFAIVAVCVAAAAASQDIVVDAYNADLLSAEERAAGSATYVMGYKVAMLMSGMLAQRLSDDIVWPAIYLGMAGLVVVGIVATFLAEEPPPRDDRPRTLEEALIKPFADFFVRLGWRRALLVFAFAATYKFGENFAQVLTIVAWKRVLHYTGAEIAYANKLVGTIGFAIGGAIGAGLVAQHGLRRMLVVFGVLQGVTQALYIVMYLAGHDIVVFGTGVFVENVAFAMATSAFAAAFMSVVSPAVSATQMALLTSLSSVGSRVFGFAAADVQASLGWPGFFAVSIALGVPGLAFAWLAFAPQRPKNDLIPPRIRSRSDA
jgi:PAT family beta-lactamase induction signal transducer AmpG